MVKGKTCIFDTCSLVYIYMHSRKSSAHTLLLQLKKPLEMEYVLAKNDLSKDFVEALHTKFIHKIRILFSFLESPRDEFFEQIKALALDKHRITFQDVQDEKLTDIDIVRLAYHLKEQGKDVMIITDDEGVHNIVKDLAKGEESIKCQYTHLFFLQMLPFVSDPERRQQIIDNVTMSYYYLQKFLRKKERTLPYEKVITTSIEILSKVSIALEQSNAKLQQQIFAFIENGTRSNEIKKITPLLEIMRRKRTDPDFLTENACLELMQQLRTVLKETTIPPIVIELIHKELASYHLELAEQEHLDLNLVGALAHVRAAAQSIVFLRSYEENLQRNASQLLFIEALLLLELGSIEESMRYLEQFLESQISSSSELEKYRSVATALLVIYNRKVGLIKDQSAETLLLLAKEALAIPNPGLAKKILSKMLKDEKLSAQHKKSAAQELLHLANLRLLSPDNPLIADAAEILKTTIKDRTLQEPDQKNLEKIKEDFNCKIAKPYHGPWEIAEIIEKRKRLWVYAWNERLKSFWVLDLPTSIFEKLEKAKTITFLSGKILAFKKPMKNEEIKFRRRIIFDEQTLPVIDEKRALPLW
ncbi:MAG: hypothetical protein ACTSXO_12100 [Candidatus Heimdallarchaeota archaeon]